MFSMMPKIKKVKKKKNAIFKIEKDALKVLPKGQFDIISWNRTKKQNKLKPLGDYDKDKVMNVFDCEPFNKKKQGYIDKTINLVKGYGFVEDSNINQYPTVISADKAALKQAAASLGSGIVKGTKAITTGAKKVYVGSGIPQAIKERQEEKQWETDLRKQAREEAKKAVKILSAEQIVEQEKERLLKEAGIKKPEQDTSRLGTGISKVQGKVRETTDTVSAGVRAALPVAEGDRIKNLIGYGQNYYGGGVGVLNAVSDVGANKAYLQKVYESVGGQQPQSQTMQQPMSSSVQQIEEYSTGPNTSPPEPGMVWSERSKRWVRYPRGSYNKRRPTVIYQQPMQQPVQQY